jgi:acetylornithine deacetylase
MPHNEILGDSTLNIGVISGGRAPNVIADEARAEIMFRLVDDGASLKEGVRKAVAGRLEAREVICIPALHLGTLEGFETCVVAFTTDIPAFGGAWGEPYLFGPGTIHLAHTAEERINKDELIQSVGLYKKMVKQLLSK